MLKEFKEFALKGNVLDMAVGVIMGGAFAPIVNSLVSEVFMPILGLVSGAPDFTDKFLVLKAGAAAGPYATLAAAKEAGASVISYGVFLNTVISFFMMSIAVFLFVKVVNKMRRQPAPADPTEKACPHCALMIPIAAKRCGHCTSQL